MKKSFLVICLVLITILVTGCGNKVEVSKCVLKSNNAASGYALNSVYNIYAKNDEVVKVVTKETVTSSSTEVLNYFASYLKKTYDGYNNTYGGYTVNVVNKDGKVVSEVTVDYTKLNIKKFVQDNSVMKSYVDSNNMITKEGIKKIYTTLGATCDN